MMKRCMRETTTPTAPSVIIRTNNRTKAKHYATAALMNFKWTTLKGTYVCCIGLQVYECV